MKSLFWQIAFRLYNNRKPSISFEVVSIGFGALFTAMYVFAVAMDPTSPNLIRLLVAVIIVGMGFAHLRVRKERAKGPMALYLKAKAEND